MAKLSLAWIKDPIRRPRYILWIGVASLAMIAFFTAAMGATTTYWFCANFCHSVQKDAVASYDDSSHNMVPCSSCHMPLNADPATFVYKKAYAGIKGVYQMVTTTYAVPLNADSRLALNFRTMGEAQCTQCHSLATRPITPSEGIIIDHEIHSENDIHCTVCHNRVGHIEDDIEIYMRNPVTGERAAYHADFMTMTACFRCHTLTEESPSGERFKATGECSACHPADFDLKPANHDAENFLTEGHAELAMMEVDHFTGRPGEDIIAPIPYGQPYVRPEGAEAPADYVRYGGSEDVLPLVYVQEVNYCGTCHLDQFCMDCHGMEMPHPEEFETTTHPELAATQLDKCEMCHQQSTTYFCDSCHHGTEVSWEFDTEVKWLTQHAETVVTNGVTPCIGACHDHQSCVDCHVEMEPLPTSHRAADWLRNQLTYTKYPDTPAVATAAHALEANESTESCDVCHGPGGMEAKFCRDCHGMDIPHPDSFKANHVTGRNMQDTCYNCHQLRELCSTCHHQGARNDVPWTARQHAVTVAETGAQPCYKCHEPTTCTYCHTRL